MNKFPYLKFLKNVERFRGIKNTRFNKIRLDANERVSDFPRGFLNKIKRKINSNYLTSYPEVEQIYSLLKKNFGFKKDNYFLTAGSDIAIRHCFELFSRPNSQVICLSPTFGMYDVYCKIFQVKHTKISFDKNLNLHYEYLMRSINKKTSFIIFANPNSPTGTIIEDKKIISILKKAKKNNCFVIIDEAYYGFYKKTFASYINRYKNLIIIRTFSKAYGLAGVRAGYLISNKHLIERLYKLRPMYEINALAVLIIKEVLKNKNEVKKYIRETSIGKKYLIKELKKLKLNFYKTYSNFILVNFLSSSKQKKIYKNLLKNNILVRYPPNIDACQNYLRFTLGPKKYMQILVKNLAKGIKIKNEK
tara:strand:- start:8017 stop:9102 length:1086 start_codon:yes stop_codon:yes gene_type:complete